MTWFQRQKQLIAKFNPYHDEHGRFASAGQSTVASRMLDSIKNGGFTYDPTGKVPTKGYSVGVYPERSAVIPLGSVTKKSIADWMARNTSLLKEKDNMLGGWTDDGKLYLDVVKIFPPNEKDAAMRAGKEHNQISIANLDAIHNGDWENAIFPTGGDGKNGEIQKSDKPHFVLATPDTSVTEFLDRLKIKPV